MHTSSLFDKQLVLFMTRGMSLSAWAKIGMFDREVALYLAMLPYWSKISIVTYGGKQELNYADKIAGIHILCNRWQLPAGLYRRLIPLLHASTLRQASVFKTNQTSGGQTVLACAKFHHKPFAARSGYMLSDFVKRGSSDGYSLAEACRLEIELFTAAKIIVVSSGADQEKISANYSIPAEKIQIIPNYVRSDIFSPTPENHPPEQAVFVGRLGAQKNLINLEDAFAGLDYKLLIIGDGPLSQTLKQHAQELSIKAEFIQHVDHLRLPDYLNNSSIFVLPSLFEGHPKALIEAMSCGLPVLGADSPGIREIISHNQTGYLCGTDPQSIRQAVITLMHDPELRRRLGENARKYVLDHYALDKIVQMELDIYRSIL
ncbi:MAG: glycosyltransferase family 4 protein [Anaerolineaceae bacterium]|nr:glycosyltransferase family 4 protein [Anaerolineaceae bacterium]